MTTPTQTLAQALHLATTGKSAALARAASCLDHCPVGGWGETVQAKHQLAEALPRPEDREYTIAEFVEAAYYVSSGHYYRRASLAASERCSHCGVRMGPAPWVGGGTGDHCSRECMEDARRTAMWIERH